MIPDGKFAKRDHLLKTGEFMQVYRKGRSLKQDFLVLYYLPNGLGHNRIGFSMSSRKIRLAVSRNRLRRLLREAFRRHRKSLKTGYDLVIVATRNPASLPGYAGIEALFLKMAGSASILL